MFDDPKNKSKHSKIDRLPIKFNVPAMGHGVQIQMAGPIIKTYLFWIMHPKSHYCGKKYKSTNKNKNKKLLKIINITYACDNKIV